MRQTEYIKFLDQDNNIISKDKAVRSRVSKARGVEEKLNVNLDDVVIDDDRMFDLLINIKNELSDSNGAKQNAVRKYYIFVNNREFPSLAKYQRNKK
jgi:hypothetical protein